MRLSFRCSCPPTPRPSRRGADLRRPNQVKAKTPHEIELTVRLPPDATSESAGADLRRTKQVKAKTPHEIELSVQLPPDARRQSRRFLLSRWGMSPNVCSSRRRPPASARARSIIQHGSARRLAEGEKAASVARCSSFHSQGGRRPRPKAGALRLLLVGRLAPMP